MFSIKTNAITAKQKAKKFDVCLASLFCSLLFIFVIFFFCLFFFRMISILFDVDLMFHFLASFTFSILRTLSFVALLFGVTVCVCFCFNTDLVFVLFYDRN